MGEKTTRVRNLMIQHLEAGRGVGIVAERRRSSMLGVGPRFGSHRGIPGHQVPPSWKGGDEHCVESLFAEVREALVSN